MNGETAKLLCAFRRYSQACLCAARRGVEKRKGGRKRSEGPRLQAATIHLSACQLHLGIWGRLRWLYGPALRGRLGATGHDKSCVCITQMLRRGGGGQGGGRDCSVSQQPHTVCHHEMQPRGSAGAQICPSISEKDHKELLSEVFNIISWNE